MDGGASPRDLSWLWYPFCASQLSGFPLYGAGTLSCPLFVCLLFASFLKYNTLDF